MTDSEFPQIPPAPDAQPPSWIPLAQATPPPAPGRPQRRRLTPRWRLAVAATAAFMLGCGAAGGVAAVVTQHASSASTVAGTAPQGYSQTLQTYGGGSDSAGLWGATGGSSRGTQSYDFPQFGDFSQFGLTDPALGSGTSSGASAASTSDASAEQSKGVVEITSTLNGGVAAGTGMILTSSGVVVTNHHVVAGATAVKVTDVSTGESYEATYVGGDATSDIAVLRLKDASGLTPVTFANSAASVGDEITSVGDAGGDGGSLTASPGTVSALGQNITVQEDDGSSAALQDLIQLDAYIVPGDSGGGVFDSDGKVVGMNVAASSGSSTVVGYAIPAQTVASTVDQILAGSNSSQISYGHAGYLGVGLAAASAQATVASVVSDGAAAKAGITAGDVITSVDGTAVSSAEQLQALVASTTAGERVRVTWQTTSGEANSATVTLGTGPIA